MRILASVHLFLPRHNCGSEAMLFHVLKYLQSKGHHCRVLLHQDKGIETPYTYEGIEVFGSKVAQRVDAYAWADVILTHLDFTQYTIAMAMQAKRPLVHMVHNDITYYSIENAIRGQYIVYNSQWCADRIGYRWPSTVLHPPCDVDYYNVNDRPQDNEYITLISMNERKGGYRLKEIAEAMPDRKFMGVVGSYDNSGPRRLEQSQIIAMMPPNVKIVPNSPDILSVYRQTRLLIMPSDYESWGRTATEAMCNGIPVICTPTPGLKENCGPAGVYVGSELPDPQPGEAFVDFGSVQDWVDAIKKMDNAKTYRKYSLLCRSRAAELRPAVELERLEQFLYNARF